MRSIILFTALMFIFSFAEPSEKLSLPQELRAEELPWFALVTEENGAYNGIINRDNLKEFVKQKNGKGVVFVFFATWCIPCREGLKLISTHSEEFKSKGIQVILINIGEDNYGKINKWVKQYAKKEWLLGFDQFGNIPPKFGLAKQDSEMTFPKILVLDSNLRPLMLIGQEGDDFPEVLWGYL